MKKKYDPIRMPVCRCGHAARYKHVRSVIYSQFPNVRNLLRIPQAKMYDIYCPACDGSGHLAGTKRAAVAAFEKAVAIHVEG